MNLFLRQWQAWRKKPPPFAAYHSGERHAPTYSLEVELDHVRSSFVTMVDGHMAKREWDFQARINEEMLNLQLAEAHAADLIRNNIDASTLNGWIADTRLLLAEFRQYLG